MGVTDAEIRMWAMDRALDSFNRKNWDDAFLRAAVLCEWAKLGTPPPLHDDGSLDLDKFFEGKKSAGGENG